MKSSFIAVLVVTGVTLGLAGCGAGSADNVAVPDYSQAIKQAVTNYNNTMPKSNAPAYTGAFAAIEGQSVGFVSGQSDDDVARKIAQAIVADPAKNAAQYKLLLSDAGLRITVYGGSSGIRSQITGMMINYPDVHYVAKLGKDGNVGIVRV